MRRHWLLGSGLLGEEQRLRYDLRHSRPEVMVVSWNVCGIGNSKVDDILDSLSDRGIRPDVLFLQEFTRRRVANFTTVRNKAQVLIGARRGQGKSLAIALPSYAVRLYEINLDFAMIVVTDKFI